MERKVKSDADPPVDDIGETGEEGTGWWEEINEARAIIIRRDTSVNVH